MRLINSARFTAVIDANVLYPIVVRDYLLWLAYYELYTPKWSEKLLEEFTAIFARKNLDITPERIDGQVKRMEKAFPDACVGNYESLIETIELPDKGDRHVMAVAVKCGAHIIVTYNLKDFPKDYLQSFGLEAIAPDDFLADLIDLSPERCCDAFREMILTKNNPPYDEQAYIAILRKNGLHQTADELEKHL